MSSVMTRLLALILFIAGAAIAAPPHKIETTGAYTDPAASESIRGALEKTGYRVILADGAALCDIWFRSELPGAQKLEGSTYTGLGESALVAVISFPKNWTDYRGQTVKAGSYTLRYALHPVDGNHMGISPIRDFLLLIPVADDPDPNASFKFEQLTKLSAKASGTSHPAAISLVSIEGQKEFPAVSENELGHVVFAAKLKPRGVEMSVGLVVKGVAEH